MKIKSSRLYWFLKFVNSIVKLYPLFRLKQIKNPSVDKTILIFTSLAIFSDHLLIESVLAKFLRKKNIKVFIVLCDKQMHLCHSSDRYSFANNMNSEASTDKKQK